MWKIIPSCCLREKRLAYNSTVKVRMQENYMKILIFLKVEANPEFCLEVSIDFRAERLGDIRNLESFHEFQVNGNAEEEELKSIAKRSDGICFTKEREESRFVESLKSVEFRWITFNFSPGNVEKHNAPDRSNLADNRRGSIY